MAEIDKPALVAALKNATQSPVAVEQVILRLEQGDFDEKPPAATPKKGKRQEPETAVASEGDVEQR